MIYSDTFLKDEKKKEPVCPLLLLQNECLIPYEMQMSSVFNFKELIKKNKTMARDQWDCLFGAFIPEIDYERGDPIEKCIDQFEQWAGRYPE